MGPAPALCAANGFLSTTTCSSTRSGSSTESPGSSEQETTNIGSKNVPKTKLSNVTVIKRSNKPLQSLNLPVIANINPRSVYNKVNEFHTLVEQEEIDVVFMSETWERENLTLNEIINLEDHSIISNVYQRKGKGGRPAIVVNKKKFTVQNLTNTLINIKWGVEVVWCLLTPVNVTPSSKIQKVACASVYCKPGSKHKTDLQDHIAEAFNMLSTKYRNGLHFIIAGDTNDLNLTPILNLSPNLKQIVNKPTRLDPVTFVEKLLDPVITTLSSYYQTPQCLPPLDSDPEKNGKPSDHRIVLVKPICSINNQSSNVSKQIKVRPITESGMINMRNWMITQNWSQVYEAETAHGKAQALQTLLVQQFDKFFPEKTRKVSSQDQPWISHKLKHMDRKRKREYHKNRRSEKWHKMNKQFKKLVKDAKKDFYQTMTKDLLSKNTSQWYSSLKRMTNFDQEKFQKLIIPDISHLSDKEQAYKLADQFSEIPNQYNQLKTEDIKIQPINPADIPQFKTVQVWWLLSQLKTNKSTVKGDISAKVYKELAAYIAEPLTHVYNTSLLKGEYPNIYKYEVSTPVPKKYPVKSIDQMRNISGLLTADKIFEKLLSELILSDLKHTSDKSQYGNEKETSIQHYLIKMIHRILEATDINTKREVFAVVANMIDWSSAFVRQCPKKGVESFQRNGVRNSLIPLLVSYFQERHMSVKWRGFTTSPRRINGGGPQGATLGILEYLSQTNNSADCVGEQERFKFIDDLTILEIVNLLTIGLSSLNIKAQIQSDMKEDNQYISPGHLQSQIYLDKINSWTENQEMKINTTKTKTMVFNFTNKYQFGTRLKLGDEQLETVTETKLLGTILTNDLKWDQNTNNIVKRAYARMELLRKLSGFGAPTKDLKSVYITFIRSVCEQSSNVWHSGLSLQNTEDLERIQKIALKIILKEKYKDYKNALNILDLEELKDRREKFSLNFAQKCLRDNKMKHLFPPNNKNHQMKTRKSEHSKVFHVHTERLKNSLIIYMQNQLNKEVWRKIEERKFWNN